MNPINETPNESIPKTYQDTLSNLKRCPNCGTYWDGNVVKDVCNKCGTPLVDGDWNEFVGQEDLRKEEEHKELIHHTVVSNEDLEKIVITNKIREMKETIERLQEMSREVLDYIDSHQ